MQDFIAKISDGEPMQGGAEPSLLISGSGVRVSDGPPANPSKTKPVLEVAAVWRHESFGM
jgi:hypothetical protein